MILTDAGVIIAYLRGRHKTRDLLDALPAAAAGVTRAEVLHGVRTPDERSDTVALLDSLAQVADPQPLWDAVGDNLARLRSAGLTVPFPDVILATVAIAYDLELWGRDQHFKLMAVHLPGLRLFVEP